MATYRFPPMMTLLAWEKELQDGPYAVERAWSEPDPADHLNLDFSRVEFADFGALARALLLLDAAVKLGIPATVILPTRSVLPTSEPASAGPTLADRRARARGDALFFMRQVGFIDSLRAPHWGNNAVRILDRATASSQEARPAAENQEPDSQDAPYQRRRVFPFRWLEPMPTAQLRESESFTALSAGLENLGLSRSDAQTLSQTVLTELVENVAKHANDHDRPPVALVGAILMTAETYALRQNGIHGQMAEVAERALADDSHILQLIVADSGVDLVGRLMLTDEQHHLDARQRKAILAALGKPSGATVAGNAGQNITGLRWVAQVVRSYQGGVQARTADLLAGLLFGRDPDGTDLVEDGYSHVPGTLVELTLPIAPSPPRPRPAWGSLSIPDTAPHMSWVHCSFEPQRGLTDADRTRLMDRMHGTNSAGDDDGLIVTVPLHDADHTEIDDRWRRAIQQILEYASSIAQWGPVVVVFPDAEPHLLDSCTAAFNEELVPDAGGDAPDPILVVGRHGGPAWCGGSAALRAVLSLLSENEGTVDVAEAQECWQRADGEPTRFPAVVQTNRHLLSSGPKRLELRLSLRAVLETLARAASKQATEAVDLGGAGVELGVFRAPTLRLVDRWISVEELLIGTVGVSLAGFVLARKVESALRTAGPAEAPTRLVEVSSAPRRLARQLSECLTLGGRYYPRQSEFNADEPPIGEQVPPGARVVLCTDVICTENAVRRAVAMIAGRDADPVIIACVVDARDVGGPVTLLNRIIPVISLAEARVSFRGSTSQKVIDVDPLTLRPEVPALRDLMPGAGVDLLTWFESPRDLLRLGHIDNPPRRHYSAFIRLQAKRQQEGLDQVTSAVLSNVKSAFADVLGQVSPDPVTADPLAIWYVAADGNAGTVAEIVHESLAAEGFQVKAVTPIPRWIAGDAWVFPTSLSNTTTAPGVLIVHWWAITGSTLLQLIRLAAKSGAKWIAAVCVLNQLTDANHAEALRMLRAVSVPVAVDSTDYAPEFVEARNTSSIPVSIRFVARSSIIAFDAHGCPICATRERYQLDDEAAPSRLINHAELLRDMLRPRELDEVARDSASDLFTVPVTSLEASDYFRWRDLLLRARHKVPDRQELIDRLRALTTEPPESEWTSLGLIRLLAAEQQWLGLPPLYFQLAADLLSKVCVGSFEQLTAPLWLRVQALMVLASAVPQGLVELLPRLLASAGSEPVLIDQMLLDCCRLLLRAPGSSPIDVVRLRHSLLDCRRYLEEQRTGSDAPAAEDHLHAVRNLLTIADYRILSKPQTPQAAWERLSEDLVEPVIRHRLEADLLLVRSFVEDIERVAPTPESARGAEADWDICARQLEERALANLPPLREILAGDFVSDWLGGRDQRRLLTLARPDLGELRAVTERLHALGREPWRPGDPSWQAVRRELLDRINWWNRIFVAAHLTDDELPALLVELIRSAPSKPGACVARLLESHHVKAMVSGNEYDQTDVFCPERLLDQIVAHLLENIEKRRIAGATCRLHIEYKQPDQGTLHMVVRNSGTAACKPVGRGLKALNDKLRPFGGSLSGKALNEGEWTFAAAVALPLWRGD